MKQHLLLEAISFAVRRHQGQMRKDRSTPYIAHPIRVMMILARNFSVQDPEVLAAAVLHDTIEDTTTDRDDIADRFGERVAGFVAALTKDKRLAEEEREDRYFEQIGGSPVEVQLCKLGDALDNLADSIGLAADFRRKTLNKTRRLLDRISPGFPEEWKRALEAVRAEMEAVEKTL